MAKIHSYTNLLPTGEDNTLNTQTSMRAASSGTYKLYMKDNPKEASVVSDLCFLSHQQGSSTRVFPAGFTNYQLRQQELFPSEAVDLV